MHERTRAALCELVATGGTEVWQDYPRCAAFLFRACPGYAHEVQQLLLAIDRDIVAEVHALTRATPWHMVAPELMGRLGSELPHQQSVEVVEAWALALGKITRHELAPAPQQSAAESEYLPPNDGWMWATIAVSVAILGCNGGILGGVLGGLCAGATGAWWGGLLGVTVLLPLCMLLSRLFERFLTQTTPVGIALIAMTVATTMALMWSWGGVLAAIFGGLLASVVTLPAILFGSLGVHLVCRSPYGDDWKNGLFVLLGTTLATVIALWIGASGGWISGGACGMVLVALVFRGRMAWAIREERNWRRTLVPLLPMSILPLMGGALAGFLGDWLMQQLLGRVDASDPGAFYLDLAGQERRLAFGLIYLTLLLGLTPASWWIVRWLVARSSALQAAKPSLVGHTGTVYSCEFSPDGQQIVTAGHDKTVRLWETATDQLQALFVGHEAAVTAALWTPDGKQIVSVSVDNTLRLWDVQQRQAVRVIPLPTERLQRVVLALSPDGLRAATAYEGEIGSSRATWLIHLWDLATGEQLHTFEGHGSFEQLGHVKALTFAGDGKRLVSAGVDGTIRLWDVHAGKEDGCLKGHTGPVTGVCFLVPTVLVSVSHDRTVRFWEISHQAQIKMLVGEVFPYSCVKSLWGSIVVAGSENGLLYAWELEREELIEEFNFGVAGRRVEGLAVNPAETKLVSTHVDGSVRIWDLPEPEDDTEAAPMDESAPTDTRNQ